MNFISVSFLIFFISIFTLYWALKKRSWQNALLLGGSYLFYSWWDYRFCSLMLISTIVDYTMGLGIANSTSLARKRTFLALSIVTNLGLLGVFKYFNFFGANLEILLNNLGYKIDTLTLDIILPVGISFYTFQTMSYTIDIFRGQLKATSSFLDFATYVSFFPQLVAGPIERASNLLSQFQKPRQFNQEQAVDGLRQILWGAVKKLVIADFVAGQVDRVYSQPELFSGEQILIATFYFAFQIYCDFSAYSDIAIGTAKLFGFQLMRNFAFPYFSQNLAEFWRRWHISLSTWLRDYIYIPLGGNRVAPARVGFNTLLTFAISGLWHGASWNFVLWGTLHGLGVLALSLRPNLKVPQATAIPCGTGFIPSVKTVFNVIATFLFVLIGWIFFRAENWEDTGIIFHQIFTTLLHPQSISLKGTLLAAAAPRIGLLLLLEWSTRQFPHPLHLLSKLPRIIRWVVYTFLLWAALYFSPGETGPFIYFQF